MSENETKASAAQRKEKLEYEIEIAAPVEAVWKALTDATELVRWFPLEAEVKPGVGGTIRLSWGPDYDGTAPSASGNPSADSNGRRLGQARPKDRRT